MSTLTTRQLEASREFWQKALNSLFDELKLDLLKVIITSESTVFLQTEKHINRQIVYFSCPLQAGNHQTLEHLKETREYIKEQWSMIDAQIQQQAVHHE